MSKRFVYYVAEPTLAAFHASGAFVRGVMGPVGSGKSSAMCVELLRRALTQPPGADGTRRTRFAVVRATAPELKTTTLKTWEDWLPPDICKIKASPPATGTVQCPLADGTRLDAEFIFLALQRAQDARKLLSLELTGAWVNEAREVDKAVVDGLTGRVGRYPPKSQGGPAWSGVILDTNPPHEDHWYHRLAEEEAPPGWEFFHQPPALVEDAAVVDGWAVNPAAENLVHQPLGAEYWLRQTAGKSRRWIDVYLLGRYGAVADGTPVYPEYDDARHLAAGLQPLPGVPLLLGWDFGLTPACVAAQVDSKGRLLVLAEWIGESIGIRSFVRQVVKPALRERFDGLRVESVGDPAGVARAQTDERTCFEELQAAGLPTQPAATNTFTARREAVAGFLSAEVDGGPRFLLDSSCRVLRRGFASGYRFAKLAVAGESGVAERPEKNRYSHIHDALQYAALTAEEGRAYRPAVDRRHRGMPGGADAVAGY